LEQATGTRPEELLLDGISFVIDREKRVLYSGFKRCHCTIVCLGFVIISCQCFVSLAPLPFFPEREIPIRALRVCFGFALYKELIRDKRVPLDFSLSSSRSINSLFVSFSFISFRELSEDSTEYRLSEVRNTCELNPTDQFVASDVIEIHHHHIQRALSDLFPGYVEGEYLVEYRIQGTFKNRGLALLDSLVAELQPYLHVWI